MDKKKVSFYVRVSTDAQVNRSPSIVNQRQKLEQELKYRNDRRHENEAEWVLAEIFQDRGRSGKDTDRPGLHQLRAAIRERKVDVVMVTELSRISRSLKDACELCEEFKAANVDFICLRERFDTTDPAGKLFFQIASAFAEFERERLIERTRAGVLQMRLRGEWFGRRILGYRPTKGAEGRVVLVKEEASVVKLAFDLYEELGSLQAVADDLNRRGYRTQNFERRTWDSDQNAERVQHHGNTPFSKENIRGILSSLRYTGFDEINPENEGKPDLDGAKLEDRYYLVTGKWPAIISRRQFDHVQELIRANRETGHNQQKERFVNYLLQGRVFCARCGARAFQGAGTSKGIEKATGKNRLHGYYHLRCGCFKGNGRQKTYGIPSAGLETAVLKRMEQLAASPELMDAIFADARAHLGGEESKRHGQIVSLQKEVDRLGKDISGVIRQMASLSDDEVRNTVQAEIRKMEEERSRKTAELERLRSSPSPTLAPRDELARTFGSLGDALKCLSSAQQRDLLRLVVNRIEVDRMEIRIGLNVALTAPLPDPNKLPLRGEFVRRPDWLLGEDLNLKPSG